MRRLPQLPAVAVTPEGVMLDGGLDLITPPGYARLGTCRFALNYELEYGGGYRRLGGFERFDGRPRPSDASYALLEATAGFSASLIGSTVVGQTSGATGRVFYQSADLKQLGVTRVVGSFVPEVVKVGTTVVGTVTDEAPSIEGFTDNILSEGAANNYRADIAKPAGTGPIRGVAVLNNIVYCWRDVSGALVTYKQSATGWTVVPLYSEVGFTSGSAAFVEGGTLTQGAASATVKRVVLESGSWTAGTAVGRLIVDPVSGAFAAGAAGGSGIAGLLGPATQITMFGGGRIQTEVYNFRASLDTRRLYCCDGMNREWEFDGDVLVPIVTGMGSVRAEAVRCHKNHLFFLYRGSVQHSGLGLPYQWSPVVGAGELGTGDIGTNLISVSGSESSAALMVMCKDSVWVLYGNTSLDWDFKKISEQAGGQRYSAQEMGAPIAFDREGFTKYTPTQSFGNFSYESASRAVVPLLSGASVKASVLVSNKAKYRCFFADGIFMTGTPVKGGMGWMACDYGRVIECAVGAEINNEYRIFYGDTDGWVLEADVGRSFDGGEVEAYLRLASQNQRSPTALKQYRHVEIDSQTETAFDLAVAAEFSDSDPDIANVTVESMQDFKQQYGSGLFWDFNSWDRAYWDAAASSRLRYAIHGQGRSVTLLVRSVSTDQLPHSIKSLVVLFTPRRMSR